MIVNSWCNVTLDDIDRAYDMVKDNTTNVGKSPLLRAITLTIKGYEERKEDLLIDAADLFFKFGSNSADTRNKIILNKNTDEHV